MRDNDFDLMHVVDYRPRLDPVVARQPRRVARYRERTGPAPMGAWMSPRRLVQG
jgi:hypothetical protein